MIRKILKYAFAAICVFQVSLVAAQSAELRCPTTEEFRQLKSNGNWQMMTGTAVGVTWMRGGMEIPQNPVWVMAHAVMEPDMKGASIACYTTTSFYGPMIQANYPRGNYSSCTFGNTTLPSSSVTSQGAVLGWTACATGSSCILKCQ